MNSATLTLTSDGLFAVSFRGIEYEGTPSEAVLGALLFLLEPDGLLLRASTKEDLLQLQAAHSDAVRLAYKMTALLALRSPSFKRETAQALFLNACALSPEINRTTLMKRTRELLAHLQIH